LLNDTLSKLLSLFPLVNHLFWSFIVIGFIFRQLGNLLDGVLSNIFFGLSSVVFSLVIADIFIWNFIREKLLKLNLENEIILAWLLFLLFLLSDLYYYVSS